MTPNEWIENARKLTGQADQLNADIKNLAEQAKQIIWQQASGGSQDHNLVMALTVFALACFVGYYVVWRVTPALHSPLMAVTNAVSSVIIVGALLAVSDSAPLFTQIAGFIAIMLASVNIFGGFVITARMLSKFRSKSNISRKKS
ncbi:MAG: NAD(P) transhydrogenase subunit alpha [Rhodospirillaceae bacterium]|nr:NAD(P) transhydrogenase subunit alpha [Rhodospirillaceae bacterium]